MQVVLFGVWVSGVDWLILDEFSNYFDVCYCQWLYEWLWQWCGGLLVISYDCELLVQMQQIVEFDVCGLCCYGGLWQYYVDVWVVECVVVVVQFDYVWVQYWQ